MTTATGGEPAEGQRSSGEPRFKVSLEPPERWVVPKGGDGGEGNVAGYYGQPVLMPAPWHWLVICYFYLGGIAGSAYILSVLAHWFGAERGRPVARAGTLVSLLTIAPVPALLIADLGRPARFHHMLRIVKPLSPMNMGSWALTGLASAVGLTALHAAAEESRIPLPGVLRRVGRLIPVGVVGGPGSLLALFFSGYTGTLLAFTANPLWSRTPLLGPLFMASAAATGTAAVGGALALAGEGAEQLDLPEAGALAGEAALAGAYLAALGPKTRQALTDGRHAKWFWGGYVGVGLLLPLALSVAPGRSSRGSRLVRAAATLAGGFCLRLAVVQAGEDSARDPSVVLGE
jgi:formate-dependent nitrite reductase membrane component NrfD